MLSMPCAKHEWRQNGARTVRGVHAQRTRIMLRPISYCAELGSGGGGWPSQMAPEERFLGRSDLNQKTALMAATARTRRVQLSRPILTMPN